VIQNQCQNYRCAAKSQHDAQGKVHPSQGRPRHAQPKPGRSFTLTEVNEGGRKSVVFSRWDSSCSPGRTDVVDGEGQTPHAGLIGEGKPRQRRSRQRLPSIPTSTSSRPPSWFPTESGPSTGTRRS
jgi:hypothetical protein